MIERNDIMSENKITIEELQKQRDEAKKVFELLDSEFEAAKQEAEDRRKAEFALQKADRQKEVVDAYNKFNKLLKDFINDYDYFTVEGNLNDWLNSTFCDWSYWRF